MIPSTEGLLSQRAEGRVVQPQLWMGPDPFENPEGIKEERIGEADGSEREVEGNIIL